MAKTDGEKSGLPWWALLIIAIVVVWVVWQIVTFVLGVVFSLLASLIVPMFIGVVAWMAFLTLRGKQRLKSQS